MAISILWRILLRDLFTLEKGVLRPNGVAGFGKY